MVCPPCTTKPDAERSGAPCFCGKGFAKDAVPWYNNLFRMITWRGADLVFKSAGNPGVQILSGQDGTLLRGGHDRHCGPQRKREIEYLRRRPLGHGGAVHQGPAGRQDGGRNLRRHGGAQTAGLRGGLPGAGQHRPHLPDGGERGDGHPAVLPLGGERVLHQPPFRPPEGRERAVHGHRPGPGGLLHHRAGPH